MIRPFTDNDADRGREIFAKCFDKNVDLPSDILSFVKNRYTKPGYLESESRAYTFFVFTEEGKILGIGAFGKNKICKIYVDPECQGQGIGSTLMQFLESEVEKQGYKELILFAYNNAIPFYEKRGYKIVGPYIIECEGVEIPTVEMKKLI